MKNYFNPLVNGAAGGDATTENSITISTVKSCSDNIPRSLTLDKDQLIKRLSLHQQRAGKDGPGFVPAEFKPNSTRANANVMHVAMLVLDIDDGTPYSTMLERLDPFEHVYYTSHSHRPEHPKYRIVVFLESPVSPELWPEFWRRAANHFRHMDAATKDAARLYYWPSCPEGAIHESAYHPGKPLTLGDLPELPSDGQTSMRRDHAARLPKASLESIGIENVDELKPAAALMSVVQRCNFIRHVSDPAHQNTVSEPHWMALIANTCGFEDSDGWIHAASEHHDGYDEMQTQDKIDRMRTYTPITCQTIRDNGFNGCPEGGCKTCKNEVVKSPAGLWGWIREDAARERASVDLTQQERYMIGGFNVSDSGIVYQEQRTGDDPRLTQVSHSRVDVVALGRDDNSGCWGLLLSFINLDGIRKTWTMPMDMLANGRQPYREVLLSMGVSLCPGKRASDLFAQYLMEAKPSRRVLTVDSIGWYKDVFVLPDGVYGQPSGEEVVLQLADPSSCASFEQAGSFEGWQRDVAGLAAGNSRLMLAIGISLSGPVISLLNAENIGFNLRGPSSIGKSLTLKAAASVWSSSQFVRTWNATGNGLQSVAATYNHTFLPLDEMGEAQASSIGHTVFALGGGVGRTRAKQNGEHRAAKRWQLSYLSTSERGLSSVMAEAGQAVVAGQEVRMIEIPADAGCGFGIFDELNGYEDSRRLAEALQLGMGEHYGHAGLAWVERLADIERRPDILQRIRCHMTSFIDMAACSGDAGQVSRVVSRFALVAGVGAVCCEEGVLPWQPAAMMQAVRSCVNAWLEQRGSRGEMERDRAISLVREFLMRHGSSRFEREEIDGLQTYPQRINNRAGYIDRDGQGEQVFYISADVYKNEVCAQMDARQVTKYLDEAGYLVHGESEVRHRNRRFGDRRYFYAVRGSMIDSESMEVVETLATPVPQ